MPKSQQHWGYDLCAALAVLAVVGLVFWLVPPSAEPGQRMSAAAVASPPRTSGTIGSTDA